jgi:4-hydroxybenzoate polyprenyltransferase
MKRILGYFRTRFPLGQNLLFATLIGVALQCTIQLTHGNKHLGLGLPAIVIIITITAFMLLMRLFDDLKDAETDRRLFPERPLPAGGITTLQLWLMILGVHLIFLIPLLMFPNAILWFGIAVGFAWLTFRWFFAPRFISTRLLIAFITHQPAGFFVNLWVATATLSMMNLSFSANVMMPCFIFITPVMLWELSRKIKPKGEENDYTTYSKILGPRTAAALLLLPGSVLTAGLVMFAEQSGITTLHTWLQALLFLAYAMVIYRFIMKPVRKNLILFQSSVLFTLSGLILYLIILFVSLPTVWQ